MDDSDFDDDVVFSQPSRNDGAQQEEGQPQLVGYERCSGEAGPSRRGEQAGDMVLPLNCRKVEVEGNSKSKLFQDPVHGTFRMDPICIRVIDTPPFQRLRDLHQLGLSYYVFPGASHKRFEHSLGVAFLAHKVVRRIYSTQRREVDIDESDIKCVTLAGLCHDLGHGPFSHVFDREFLKAKGITNWEHEEMSCKMLDLIIDDYQLECISTEESRRIKHFIHRPEGEAKPRGKAYLYDIVANDRNGIDVDKLDYLQRDAMACGINSAKRDNFTRLFKLSKVLNDEICYKWGEYSNLYDVFHVRSMMHRQVYTHRKAKSIEFMIVDALKHANNVFHFTDRIWDPREFLSLNDCVLNEIEHFGKWNPKMLDCLEGGQQASLRHAQQLIHKLRCRDLYRYINEVMVPVAWLKDKRWDAARARFTPEFLASCYGGSGVHLRAEDIILQENKIDFTQGTENPLDKVKFFSKSDSTESFSIGRGQVMGLTPDGFQERQLRVYSRSADPRVQEAIGEALQEATRRIFGSDVKLATPRPPRPSRTEALSLTSTHAALAAPESPTPHASHAASVGAAANGRGGVEVQGREDSTSMQSTAPVDGEHMPVRKRRLQFADQIGQ